MSEWSSQVARRDPDGAEGALFRILSCKGGGYRYCRTAPPHPKRNSNGLYPLHRVRAENKIGRLLLPGEVVHHIDGDKTNDSPENLQVLQHDDHARLHAPEVDEIAVTCGECGSSFTGKPHEIRLRQSRNRRGQIYCSRSCGGVASRRAIS